MDTRKKLLLGAVTLAVALIAWACVVLLIGNGPEAYNTAATNRAQAGGQIAKSDILLLKAITKDSGGDSKAEFVIFRLPAGAKAEDYLHLQADACDLEALGSASCTFIGDDPNEIYRLRVSYTK